MDLSSCEYVISWKDNCDKSLKPTGHKLSLSWWQQFIPSKSNTMYLIYIYVAFATTRRNIFLSVYPKIYIYIKGLLCPFQYSSIYDTYCTSIPQDVWDFTSFKRYRWIIDSIYYIKFQLFHVMNSLTYISLLFFKCDDGQ